MYTTILKLTREHYRLLTKMFPISHNLHSLTYQQRSAMFDAIKCRAKCKQYIDCCSEDCIVSMFCIKQIK